MGKIVVFGGTFNPIHIGHIEMANFVAKCGEVEKVIVIPTKIPPHKEIDRLALDCHRLKMCELAFENNFNIEVSDIEIKRNGVSYTIDTLLSLKQIYEEKELGIVCGGDMFVTLDSWRKYKDIIKIAEIFAFKRYGTEREDFLAVKDKLLKEGAKIKVFDFVPEDISSNKIKNMLEAGKNTDKYMPQNIQRYIKENNLYLEGEKK